MAKRMREQKEDNNIVAKSKPTAVNLAVNCLDKFFICELSDCVEKHLVDRLDVQGNLTQEEKEIQSRRSVEISRMAKGCSAGWTYRETCRDRKRPGTPELPGVWRYRETCRTRIPWKSRKPRKPRNSRKFRRIGNRRQNLATSLPFFTRLCTSHE